MSVVSKLALILCVALPRVSHVSITV